MRVMSEIEPAVPPAADTVVTVRIMEAGRLSLPTQALSEGRLLARAVLVCPTTEGQGSHYGQQRAPHHVETVERYERAIV